MVVPRMRRTVFTLALALVSASALAQSTPDVASAAAAFQEGQRAQLARDFARAAEMFELADRAAPSPAALRSAIRNHQAAEHLARAATLAARARARDAADPQSAQLATEVLDALAPRLSRVALRCAPACTVLVDGGAVAPVAAAEHDLFVEPGARTLEATWSGRGSRTERLDALPGAQRALSLDAPPEAPAPVSPPQAQTPPPPAPVAPAPAPLPPEPSRRPLPPAVFWSALGATVVSGAVLVWSAVDTLSARDAYVTAPTESGYLDGVGRETRTNALIATTATLAAATVVTALFTEWRGARAATHTTAGVSPLPGGALLGVIRSF